MSDLAFLEKGKHVRPTSDEELLALTETFFGITFPRQAVCPNHTAPAKAFCDAYFARSPFMVVFASRGFGGKSVWAATLSQMEFLAGMPVVTLGGSAQQSKRVLEAMERGWNHKSIYKYQGQMQEIEAPRWALTSQNSFQTNGVWGNWIKALAASETSVRGEHPTRLNLDECLTGSTQIELEDGSYKRIDEIKIGTRLSTGVVVGSKYTGDKLTYRITTTDGIQIETTGNHPFYTEKKKWEQAKVLMPGLRVAYRQPSVCEKMQTVLGQREETSDRSSTNFLPLRKFQNKAKYFLSTVLYEIPKRRFAKMSRLQYATEGARYAKMSRALGNLDVNSWSSSTNDSGQGFGYEELKKEIQVRSSRGPTIDRTGPSFRRTGLVRKMDFRLCFTRAKDCYRGTRQLLARSTFIYRARRTEAADPRERGLDSVVLERGESTYVVEGLEWKEITSIELVGIQPVYNLTVDRSHVYIANGFLVHNCDAMDLRTYLSAQGMPLDSADFPMGTVALSTRQNAGGTMDYALDFAKENGFPIAEWCYRENMVSNGGWITEDQLERKRKSITSLMWQMEYENQEPYAQGRIFTSESLERFFDSSNSVTDLDGEELIFEEFDTSADYVTSADWGRDVDFTVIETWRYDTEIPRMVSWLKVNKEPWPRQVERFNERWEQYPGKAIHDATGIGKVIMDLIEVPKDQLVHFNIGGSTRTLLFNNHIAEVENGRMQCPLIRSKYQDYRNMTSDVYKGSEHAPDSFIASALASAVMTQTQGIGSKAVKRPGRALTVRRF